MPEYRTPSPDAGASKLKRLFFGSGPRAEVRRDGGVGLGGSTRRARELSLASSPNALLLRAPWLIRRAWVVVVATVLVALVAIGLIHGKQPTYSANAILLVSPGASATSPGSPAEAQGLAVTYSGLIPNDSAILHVVGSAMDLTNAEVQHDISVNVVNGTSLLDVQFTEASPSRAITGARVVANAIAGTPPVTRAIPNGTVNVTSPPTTANRHAPKKLLTLLVGLVLGFLLGVVVMIVWEQTDARFDKPGQITGALRMPARSLRGMTQISAASLVERWRDLSHRHPARIALIAGVPGMTGAIIELSRRLSYLEGPEVNSVVTIDSRLGESNGHVVRAHPIDATTPERGFGKTVEHLETIGASDGVVLLPGGVPGAEGGEAIAQHADLSVLVVPRGARAKQVREAFVILRQVGVRPKWALLIDTRWNRNGAGSVTDEGILSPLAGKESEGASLSTSSEIAE